MPTLLEIAERVDEEMEDAVTKAMQALAGYKFWMFGYHAARWVTANRLSGKKRPNPFRGLVRLAQLDIDLTGIISKNGDK